MKKYGKDHTIIIILSLILFIFSQYSCYPKDKDTDFVKTLLRPLAIAERGRYGVSEILEKPLPTSKSQEVIKLSPKKLWGFIGTLYAMAYPLKGPPNERIETLLDRLLRLIRAFNETDRKKQKEILSARGPFTDEERHSFQGEEVKKFLPDNEFRAEGVRSIIEADQEKIGYLYEPIIWGLEELAKEEASSEEDIINRMIRYSRLAYLKSVKNKIRRPKKPILMGGDFHGNNDILKAIKVHSDNLSEQGDEHLVILHGDELDRGDQNYENYEALLKLKNTLNERAIFLFGNHNLLFILALLFKDRTADKDWVYNGGDLTIASFTKRITGKEEEQVQQEVTEKLRSVALWMLMNYKLYYIDDYGMLHIHTIIWDKDGNIVAPLRKLADLQRKLDKIQADLHQRSGEKERMSYLEENEEEIKGLLKEMVEILWRRMDDWLVKAMPTVIMNEENRRRLASLLENSQWRKKWDENPIHSLEDFNNKLGLEFTIILSPTVDRSMIDKIFNELELDGIRGIVFGHNPQYRFLNLGDNRIICLDSHRSDRFNGYMLLDNEGLIFYPFHREKKETSPAVGYKGHRELEVATRSQPSELVATKADVLRNIVEEIIRLKRDLGLAVDEDEVELRRYAENGKQKREQMAGRNIKERPVYMYRFYRPTVMERLQLPLPYNILFKHGNLSFELTYKEKGVDAIEIQIQNLKVGEDIINGKDGKPAILNSNNVIFIGHIHESTLIKVVQEDKGRYTEQYFKIQDSTLEEIIPQEAEGYTLDVALLRRRGKTIEILGETEGILEVKPYFNIRTEEDLQYFLNRLAVLVDVETPSMPKPTNQLKGLGLPQSDYKNNI